MTISNYRGHKIELVNGVWIYSETKKLVSDYKNIRCGHCTSIATKEGHDGCLGTLKGIMNACCGHGEIKNSYVQFLDGSAIHGVGAKIILDVLKSNK